MTRLKEVYPECQKSVTPVPYIMLHLFSNLQESMINGYIFFQKYGLIGTSLLCGICEKECTLFISFNTLWCNKNYLTLNEKRKCVLIVLALMPEVHCFCHLKQARGIDYLLESIVTHLVPRELKLL